MVLRTLRWALHAVRYGTMLIDRRYTEPYKMYVPGLPYPVEVEPGQRVEIIIYPIGK